MHNSGALWTDWVSCSVAVLVDWGWGPKMFFEPVPKCSPRFSNIFLRTVYVWAFEFVDNPTLLQFVIPVLMTEECFYSVFAFEMYLYSLVVTFRSLLLPTHQSGGGTNIFLVSISCGGAIPTPSSYLTPPHTLLISIHPYSPILSFQWHHLW